MVKLRNIIVLVLCSVLVGPAMAGKWISHLAYNNVTQIAMSDEYVYALSDGNIYSVNKQTEALQTHFPGMNGIGVTCISYDATGKQLLIGYYTGKIDLLSARGIRYIGELYDKDMTQRKTINNCTIEGRMAYLSTPYGVQTLDLDERKLIDSYWLRPGGQETEVVDVVLTKDSIYAFTSDSLFCASRKDNIVDYTYWKREKRSSRIQPDPNKGKYYDDGISQWSAGGRDGVIRDMMSEHLSYKPQGPLNNIAYSLKAAQGNVWMVNGGRWTSQFENPGILMRYDGERWTNIEQATIKSQTGKDALDFMNVAVDPFDKSHYFVTSYGTGLYEFKNDKVVRHVVAGSDNTLVASGNPDTYTRLDGALFDGDNHLWMLNPGSRSQLQCLDAEGQWHAVTLHDGNGGLALYTPNTLLIDRTNPNYKWLGTARYNTFLYLLDDNGTPWDESDDRYVRRTQWTNQLGRSFEPTEMRALMQDSRGRIWMGTDAGVAFIESGTDFFTSDALVQPDVYDDNGENPVTALNIYALCEDKDGNIWIGTENQGVYVLNNNATEIIAHYTTGNSTMPSNAVLSLAADAKGSVFVGTSSGLAEYDSHATPESTDRTVDEDGKRLGSIMQWTLHFSYRNPQQLVYSPSRIYAMTEGALYYVDRTEDQIYYLSKASGLNGSTVTQIAYDKNSERLIIAYEDGRIDLLDEDGYVLQMPDVVMKASSLSTEIHAILAGSKRSYLAMSFGILAINTKKGEVSDTYYIGDNASDVNVLGMVEMNDSLYAFDERYMYAASLADNIIDYHFWHKTSLPTGTFTHAAAFNNKLHILIDNVLYSRQGNSWKKAFTNTFDWIHSSGNQLLGYISGQGLFRITEDYQLAGLTNQYVFNDAIYSNGEYWGAERDNGILRLGSGGDTRFIPNGPNSNFGYFLTSAHGLVYSTVGGRWTTQFMRLPKMNICSNGNWSSWGLGSFVTPDGYVAYDPVSIAVDRNDQDHFYVSTFTSGVYEINHGTLTHYTDGKNGSTLRVASASIKEEDKKFYVRTDGAMMDENNNLWVLNATSLGQVLHVMTPDHKWTGLNYQEGSEKLVLYTPKGIWMDRRGSRYKWFMDQRYKPRIVLLDDGGTPTVRSDDRIAIRSEFVDQKGTTINRDYFYCWAQDHNDRIWIGTESGIIIIPPSVDFFTSNACERIIIPRNDGTGLGDYLLGEETINCMAVDGGNRMWIGTAGSGLYVIEDDTITVAHFTENNSLLPSDAIQSITIVPETGEVFVGTDRGIASYLSDSSEPEEDMKSAYAFPNPVRPDYGGHVAITNLMDNTEVNIVDSGGNLVCKTRSNGGTAVWDVRLPDGRRATPGIYTALCNTKGGKAAVKIMIIR